MKYLELVIIALGLSMDAFAVAICKGLSVKKVVFGQCLIVGLYFGTFQAGMPVIGYLIAKQFAGSIIAFDHWIAFALLSFIGGKMIFDSFKKDEEKDGECEKTASNKKLEKAFSPKKMLPLALATSIDALAVGVSFAFLKTDIVSAVAIIGAVTLVLSMIGVKIGNIFGLKFKSKAELIGGIILILMGIKILIEHLIS